MWPMLLDIPKDECKRILRRLELEAYGSLVSALRAQGELSKNKRQFLQDAASTLHISTERHRAEVRRAVNDEKLATIAERLCGPNTGMDWAIEGRRLVPLMPRLVPQTAFTALANTIANLAAAENAKLPPPENTAQSPEIGELEEPAPPESSRTTQNQGTVLTPVNSQQQTSSYQMVRGDENENRKRRRSSVEMPGQPESQSLPPPPPKIPSLGPNIQPSRTVTIPVNVAPVKISLATTPVRATASTSTLNTTQKVIIVSNSAGGMTVSSPSLLQRSLSVPLVKTVTTMGSLNPSCSTTSNNMQGSSTPARVAIGGVTPTGYVAVQSSVQRQQQQQQQRPKAITTTPTTVLPRRTSSIVIPISSASTATSLQLKPAGTVSNKPTLHIKPDGSGMKIIAGTSKLLPKPATVVPTTATGGSTRVVTLTGTPRVSAAASLSSATGAAQQNLSRVQPVSSTATLVNAKPVSQVGYSTPTSSTGGKPNVIVVKKGTGYVQGQSVTLKPASRGELLGKVMIRTPQSLVQGLKASTSQPQAAAGLAQAINIQSGNRQSSVIVVDLSQEQIKDNVMLSGFIQAGLLSTNSLHASSQSSSSSQPDKRPFIIIDESIESQEEQQSPTSSTDTGSSLELNQAESSGVATFENAVKMMSPVTTTSLQQFMSDAATSVASTSKGGTFRLLTPVTQVQSQGRPASKVIRLVTLDDESQDKPSTSHNEITDADMQKIEEQMMNLGEGTQLETGKVLDQLIQEITPEKDSEHENDVYNDDNTKTTEIEAMEVEEEVIEEQSSCTMSIDGNIIFNTLPHSLTQEVVTNNKMDVEETSQENSSQDQMEVCPAVEKKCEETSQEESSVSLEAVKMVLPEITESASQETQSSDLPETIGELDPQTGIFSLNSSLQDDSEDSSLAPNKPVVDIYSAAISSANINFDSGSEEETEIPETEATKTEVMQQTSLETDSEEEDISLFYTEPEEEVQEPPEVPPVENAEQPTELKETVGTETESVEQTDDIPINQLKKEEIPEEDIKEIPLIEIKEESAVKEEEETVLAVNVKEEVKVDVEVEAAPKPVAPASAPELVVPKVAPRPAAEKPRSHLPAAASVDQGEEAKVEPNSGLQLSADGVQPEVKEEQMMEEICSVFTEPSAGNIDSVEIKIEEPEPDPSTEHPT